MLRRIRVALLALLVLGIVGIGAELLLLEHYEDRWQLVPLVVLGVALVTLVGTATTPSVARLRALGITMGLVALSGAAGQVLHVQANLEFQHEIDPSQPAVDAWMNALRAKTPPALAPGAMIELGLLGLLYRHLVCPSENDEHRATNGGS